MAIGYSPMGVPFKLSSEDMGVPDLQTAIMKGLTAGNAPAKMSSELLGQHLQNAINKAKAKYAPQIEQANLQHILASTQGLGDSHSLLPLRRMLLESQAAQARAGGEKSQLMTDLYRQVMNQDSMQPYKKSLVRHLLGLPEELPTEKMQREVSTANIKEQNKSDIKRANLLKDTARDLELAGLDINGIHDILTGTDSLGTGITKTLLGKFGWGTEKLGEFNERTLRLQAQMTKALSSRGGVGAANIVASGKPSTWKSTSENLGITKAYAERIKNEFNLLNKEYKSITGKKLPYTLPEYVKNISKKINSNMFLPKTEFNSEQEYHDYMQSLKPEQRKIVINALRKQ